jgi:nucleotide-binding universal stress UspA family protein
MNTRKIVVGVEGSLGSDAALEWAIHQAGPSGAEIVAVHAVQPVVPQALAATVAYTSRNESELWWFEMHVRVEEEFCRLLKTSRIAHRIVTVRGHPATEILRVADQEDASLVVVGNGLHSTMAEIFLGSVAHELSHHAKRPLAIVPTPVPATAVDALGRKQRVGDRETLAAHDHTLTGVSPTLLRH